MKEIETEKLLAIGRLYEFCSNKRFHLLKNEFIEDNVGKKALAVNAEIKTAKGLDVFEATTDADLLEYEKNLNDYTTVFSNEHFGTKIIGDEINLYDWAVPVPIEKMKSFNYEISPGLKVLLKKYNVSALDIALISKNADAVVYIEKFRSFFITKKVKIKYKERIVLLHLADAGDESPQNTIYKRDDGSINFDNFRRVLKKANAISSDKLFLRMALFYSANISKEFLNNPVRLFIKGLDSYGAGVKINNSIKSFHANVIIPPHVDSPTKIFSIPYNPNKNHIRVISMINPSPIASTVVFMYGINMDKMLQDFITGKI